VRALCRAAPALALALGLAGSAAAQGVSLTPVAQVPSPIFAGHAGDERLFVADRSGRIWIWTRAGGVAPTPFLDFHTLVSAAGEGGFLSFAFHPDYAHNGLFYVSYTAPSPFRSVIARYRVSETDPDLADPDSAVVLLQLLQPETNHNGGQIAFGPDGFLYAGFGDGGGANDPFCRAQRDDLLYGTLLRLDVDQSPDTAPYYGIPAGNPFAGDDGIPDEIWATGLRNPWRFSFDRTSRDLYIGDVGQGAREEIDRQGASSPGGEDYGWRVMEGTSCFDDNAAADPDCPDDVPRCFDPSFTPPIFDYGRSAGDRSVTGGFVYRGRAIPDLRGLYVFGDFISGRIWSLEEIGGAWVRTELFDTAFGVASFGEDLLGEIYVMDLGGGRVLRLDPGGPVDPSQDAACIDALNDGFARVAATAAKELCRCTQGASRDKLPGTLDECVDGDPRGKVAKAAERVRDAEEKECSQPPAFGPPGAEPVIEAAAGVGAAWARDVFGADLDAAIFSRSSDKDGARCQDQVIRGLAKCEKERLRAFNACKRSGLADGSIGGSAALAGCLEADPKGRVAKSCDPAGGKLAEKAVEASCAAKGVDLSAAFPGCATGDATALAGCLDRVQRCRVCLALSAADALDAACDCP